MNTGEFHSEFSDTAIAQDMYEQILKDSQKYKHVHTLESEYPIYLYEHRDGDDVMVYFVPKNDNFIYGYVTYELKTDGGIEMYSVYNRPMYPGLAQQVYNNYLIPKYSYIMSHSQHSEKGKNFWRKIVSSNLKRNVVIWDVETDSVVEKINNINELDNFYGDGIDYEKYRIKVSKI